MHRPVMPHFCRVVRYGMRVQSLRSVIRIRQGLLEVDGKRFSGLLMLGFSRNSNLEFEAAGDDAFQGIEGIKEIFFEGENGVLSKERLFS